MAFDPPASVKLTPGAGIAPIVWKSPGIVKLVFEPAVGGLKKSPWTVMLDVPVLRSRSLVVEILLMVIEVELRKRIEAGITVPAGTSVKISWKYWSFSLFTCASRLAT